MPFIGRARERDLARDVVNGTADNALAFVGGRGIGKSRLLSRIAKDHHGVLLRVSSTDRDDPWSTISALCDLLGPGGTQELDAIIGRVASGRQRDVAIADAVNAHRGDLEQLILIDDADTMDGDSARVIRLALQRAQGRPLRLIVTLRSSPAETSPWSGLRTHRLEPFDSHESAQLAAQALPTSTEPGILRLIGMFAGGNPAVATSVRPSERERVGLSALTLPLRCDSDILPELRTPVPPEGIALMIALSPYSSAAALAAHSPDARAEMDRLLDLGILESARDRICFADPLTRTFVASAAHADQRRRAHTDAARLHAAADPTVALWHTSFLSVSDSLVRELLRAATELTASGDVTAAVEFAERAFRIEVQPLDTVDSAIALCDALLLAGEYALAGLCLTRMRSGGTSARARVHIARLTANLAQARGERIPLDDIESVLALHREDEPAPCLELMTALATLALERFDLDAVHGWMRRAAELERSSDATLLQRILDHAAITFGPVSDRRVHFGPALDLDALEQSSLAGYSPSELSAVASVAILTEHYRLARLASAALFSHDTAPPPHIAEHVRRMIVVGIARSGELELLPDAAREWRSVAVPEPVDHAPRAYANAVIAAALEDPADEAATQQIEHARIRAQHQRADALLTHSRVLTGSWALARDEPAEAVEWLSPVEATRLPGSDPALLRVQPDLIEALWLTGARAQAHDVRVRFESELAEQPSRWGSLAYHRVASVCAPDDAVEAAFANVFERAALGDMDSRRRLEAAYERRRNLVSTPTTTALESALALLDAQEVAVARLVQKGLRNHEVASTLFISQRTVELRLTRIYRKLSLGSRAHLVALMSGGAP